MTEVTPEVDSAEGVLTDGRNFYINAAQGFVSSYVKAKTFSGAIDLSNIAPSKRQKKAYYVYVLVNDFDDAVIYVGKGKGHRMFHHMREAKAGKISGLKKYKGLREIINADQSVTPYILFSGMEEKLAYTVESTMIKGLSSIGLLNCESKGDNANDHDLEWCKTMLDDIPRLSDRAKRQNPLKAAIAEQAARSLERTVEIIKCEIRIAQDTGYMHNDYWNTERYKAYNSYLSKHPDRVPPEHIEAPLFQ